MVCMHLAAGSGSSGVPQGDSVKVCIEEFRISVYSRVGKAFIFLL